MYRSSARGRFFSSKCLLSGVIRFGLPLFFFLTIFISHSSPVHAQGLNASASANPLSNVWEFSPEVTEVGRNADRARQLLWWVWTHPGIYTAPVIAQLWGVTRNIVYVMIVLVLILFGVGIMLGRRRGAPGAIFNGIASPLMGMQVPQVFMKLGTILIYVTFSYIIVLGFIQFSEVSMQFIKSLVGKDLFNVFFAGTGNIEANYTTFIGYYNTDPMAREMVNTSVFIIKMTSLTYYTMAIILILRTIILWFLLILSPFLALLMPFVFIRNTGWIWIGVFFQWLFYGPLMTLFVVALVNIWVAGIPYPFDFTRVNKPEGQIYKTSINILYGGPAQTLSSGNSANYVDTFAEYVIALVMLWTAMILPWLLLRIFRDYCCSLLASANSTMTAIFDRLRQYPPPAPPPPTIPPSTKAGMAVELPFRQTINQKMPESRYTTTAAATMREISRASTSEIARSMDLSVSSLRDVSRLEIREKESNQIRSTLERIAAPEKITSSVDRERYEAVHNELVQRANQGDKVAQTVLMASERKADVLAKQMASIHAEKAFAPAVSRTSSISNISNITNRTTERTSVMDKKTVSTVAKSTNLAEEQVQRVIERAMTSKLMTQSQVMSVAQESNMSAEKVQEVVTAHNSTQAASSTVNSETVVAEIAKTTSVNHEQVKAVLSAVSEKGSVSSQSIKEIASKTNVSESQVSDIISAATTKQSVATAMHNESTISDIAKSADVSRDAVRDVMTKVSEKGNVSTQTVKAIATETQMSEEKVASIVEAVKQTTIAATVPAQAMAANVPAMVAQKVGVSQEQVESVMNQMSTASTTASPEQAVQDTATKTGMPVEKVKAIMDATQKEQAAVGPTGPVSIEEYEDVKKMWVSHYREAPVPVSESIKDRQTWIGDEEKKLTNILNLLTSNNPEMKQKGLEQVAEILPFMLLGGFSESETIAYIQAKLSATQQVKAEGEMKEQIAREMGVKAAEEEETMVSVTTHQVAQAQKAQVRTVEMPVGGSIDASDLSEALSQGTRTTSFANDVAHAGIEAIHDVTRTSTAEITKAMNLMVHSLKDVSHFEMHADIRQQAQGQLDKISKTVASAPGTTQQQYQQIRNELVERANHGDRVAQVMLMAAEKKKDLIVQQLMQQSSAKAAPTTAAIAQKVGVPEQAVQSVLTSLPKADGKPSSVGMPVVPGDQVLKDTAAKAGIAENKVKEIVAASSPISLEEYEEVRAMWTKHYQEAPVPVSDTIKDRAGWITEEEKKMTNILNLLTSSDPQLRQQGFEQVTEILPFMLLGGFSESETIAYIQAKLAATQQVKKELAATEGVLSGMAAKAKEEQETLLEVHASAAPQTETKTVTMHTTLTQEMPEKSEAAVTVSATVAAPSVVKSAGIESLQDVAKATTADISQAMHLLVRSLKDLSHVEQSVDARKQTQQGLLRLAQPQSNTMPAESKQRYQQLKTTLVDRANHGDTMAQVMLMASEKKHAELAKQVMQRSGPKPGLTPTAIAQKVGVSEAAVQSVLTTIPPMGTGPRAGAVRVLPGAQTVKEVATKAGIPEGKVKEIVAAASAVSIDDYEEVKKMWVTYYREAPVPTSDTIHNRLEWVRSEEKKLTNVYNQMTSMDAAQRELGLLQVSELLPYILLGGLSDIEVMVYLRAKNEAAEQVEGELTHQGAHTLSDEVTVNINNPTPVKQVEAAKEKAIDS